MAPLTNTVLGAVPQHNAGVASGINNQIARVASLLAIAAVGAVVAATFESALGRAGVDPLSGGLAGGGRRVGRGLPHRHGLRGLPRRCSAA